MIGFLNNKLIQNYFRDISYKKTSHKLYFIVKLLAPLWLIFDYTKFYFTKDQKNKNDFLETLIFIFFISLLTLPFWIPSDLIKSHIGGNANYYLISFLINLLSILFLSLFSGINGDIKESIDKNHEDINSSINNVLAHKIWSGDNTYELLSSLLKNQHSDKAKWFIVKFLSYLAEDRIKTSQNKDYFKLSTGCNYWSQNLYSSFLAKNMEHAEKSIVWIVSTFDFMGVILPEMILHVLASFAISFFEIKELGYEFGYVGGFSPASLFSNFAKHKTLKKWNENNDIQKMIENSTELLIQEKDAEKIDVLKDNYYNKILPPLIKCAFILMDTHKQEIDEKKVIDGFDFLQKKYLNLIWPHLNKFGKSDSEKVRYIFLGNNFSHHESWVNDKLIEQKNTLINEINKFSINGNLLSTKINENILDLALDLFSFTCGSENNIKIIGSRSGEANKKIIDLGIYDNQYIVSSKIPDKDNEEYRIVNWYYLTPELISDSFWYNKCEFDQEEKSTINTLNSVENQNNKIDYKILKKKIGVLLKNEE